jgi:hypothetical protein
MRTRSPRLAGGMLAALLVAALIGIAAADGFVLGLDTDDTEWPIGTEANLDVTVDPVLLGGYGKLFRRIGTSTPVLVKTFDFTSTEFSITGSIPNDPELAGNDCEFWYRAFTPGGELAGNSTRKLKPVPPLELE